MKVEKISSNKFRITFTDEDLKDFDVDFENIKYSSEDAQEIFWQLIEQAEIEEEFFDEGGQIIVEAVASKNKGLTMTVTRVTDLDKSTPKIRRKRIEKTRTPTYLLSFIALRTLKILFMRAKELKISSSE